MKISLQWLNQYLDPPVAADELEAMLTNQGTPIETRQPLPADDEMLDVEVTSNRPDCLSHIGVAREVVAGSLRHLRLPKFVLPHHNKTPVESVTSVTNQSLDLCPVYTARVIKGVKVGPSPSWLVQRLEAVGLRSVNNVVDVTNFVLLEMGQPLHAFDLDRLDGKRIVVRTAGRGEPFVAIDGSRHELTQQTLVIADASKPVAIAGVMGGRDSEVSQSTANVLLESAQFDPLSVRRTSRSLRLSSDSSYRFERGVDPAGVELASRRAAALIVELAGGELCQGVIRVGAGAPQPREVTMRARRCRELLGMKLKASRMVELLGRLGLSPRLEKKQGRKVIHCVVPSHRLDLEREIDLIEEVARLHGLEHVPVQDKIRIVARAPQLWVRARQKLGQVLVAHGYHETVTFSFVGEAQGRAFVPAGEEAVMIDDVRRKSEPVLRPSLLPSLLACRKANQDVGNAGVRLFETAATWSRHKALIVERARLAVLRDAPEKGGEGLRDLRGTLEELVSQLVGDEAALRVEPATLAGYSAGAVVSLDGKRIGQMGLLDRKTQDLFDLQSPVVVAELELSPLLDRYPPRHTVGALPRFPGIERDLSVIIDEAVAWERVRSLVLSVKPALLESLSFVTVYRGKPIAPSKKSLSLRMVFRDPSATLRHEQVDSQVSAVVEKLKSELGAELRA